LGGSQPLRFELCQAIRRVLLGSSTSELWSKRAAIEIEQARNEVTTVAADFLVAERDATRNRTIWWTFAGLLGNAEIANIVPHRQLSFDNFAIALSGHVDLSHLASENGWFAALPANSTGAVKFQECLPPHILAAMQVERVSDHDAVAFVRQSRVLWRDHA
jgi:hypothetical protein